jgi:hypothetical protein
MISFTRVETREINEKVIFENLKDYLFEQDILDSVDNYVDTVKNLPKDVQRLIFAKVGAMMIDYAGSEDF